MPMAGGGLAVVTGAASDIGRAVAISFARRGGALALVDLNAASLAGTAALIPFGLAVSRHVAEIASRTAVAQLPAAVTAAHPDQPGAYRLRH